MYERGIQLLFRSHLAPSPLQEGEEGGGGEDGCVNQYKLLHIYFF